RAKTFYEKEVDEKYAITLPFDNFKISVPSSLSRGQNVYNLFYQLTSHVSDINDFSQLPIPFFCIATNIETGQAVQLESGFLPQAISASGALPSLFSPVVIDDQLLIDGGVVNNYPVEELRKKGMDIIIGVDVQDSLLGRTDLKSALTILNQINNYRTINAMKEKRGKTDIYIHPDIRDYTVVSFDKGEKIIESGRQQAKLFREEFEILANRQKDQASIKVEKKTSDSLRIDEVHIEGNDEYTRAYIMGKLKLKLPVYTTYEKINEGINNLSATGNFNQINYFFKAAENGKSVLHLKVVESNIQTLMRFSVHYDNLYRSAALINVTQKRLFQKNDVLSVDAILGDNFRYNFDYYIDKGFYWSFGIKSRFNTFRRNVKRDFLKPNFLEEPNIALNNIELDYQDFTNQIYVQTLFKQTFSLGIGAEHKKLLWQSETYGAGENPNKKIEFERTNYFSLFGYLKIDSFDDKYFPTKGFIFDGHFNLYVHGAGLNPNFNQFSIAKAKIGYAISPLKKVSVNLVSEGGFKIGGTGVTSLDFMLGGYGYEPINNFVHFYGYGPLSLRGDTFLKSSALLRFEIFRKNYLTLIGNIANVGDRLFTSSEWIDRVDYTGFALGYSMDTFIGPIELFYAKSPEQQSGHWYISLGFWF
ncbi:MAG TPA: patatin-like phospholipase family protein, partial [Flavobacteriaceae bacterium]|nr:patatin-like phospholipase family protein [Flavobacteriaceae bacterium]